MPFFLFEREWVNIEVPDRWWLPHLPCQRHEILPLKFFYGPPLLQPLSTGSIKITIEGK